MKLKILKNIAIYGVGDFLVTAVSAFLLIPIYLKFLSVSEYGIFNILNNNTTFFTYLFQFGIISAFSRIYFLKREDEEKKKYIKNIICIFLAISLLIFCFYFILKSKIIFFLSPSMVSNELQDYPLIFGFLSFLPALYFILLRLEQKASIFLKFQIFTILLLLLSIILMYLFYEINLNSILNCFLITNSIIFFIVFLNFKILFPINICYKDIIQTIQFAFPIFVTYMAYFFISKYSLVILQKHITLERIANFSLALQIASIPTLISIAINKAIQPSLFNLGSDIELKEKSQVFDENYKTFMIWIVGTIIFFSDYIFDFLFPMSYQEAAKILKYLLLINLVYNFSIIENTILMYKMKSKTILLITVFSSLINIILCNILVEHFLLEGVLIALAISYFTYFFLEIFFSKKYIKISYDYKKIITSIVIIFLYINLSESNHIQFVFNKTYLLGLICFILLTFFLYKSSIKNYMKFKLSI